MQKFQIIKAKFFFKMSNLKKLQNSDFQTYKKYSKKSELQLIKNLVSPKLQPIRLTHKYRNFASIKFNQFLAVTWNCILTIGAQSVQNGGKNCRWHAESPFFDWDKSLTGLGKLVFADFYAENRKLVNLERILRNLIVTRQLSDHFMWF